VKGLTLTQPWASLVALGHKRVETRSWRTDYRGPVLIHAAKGFPREAQAFASEEVALGRLPRSLPFSAVVAVVELVAIQRTEEAVLAISGLERRLGDYTPGRWAWSLANVQPLAVPVPAAGKLGLWTAWPELEAHVLQVLQPIRRLD
jgi:hypothetical protein